MALLIAVLVITFLFAGIGIKRGFSKVAESSRVTSEKIIASSFDEIEGMLMQLERKDEPEEKIGAMCYEVAPSPEYFEYICPVDGEKTVYNTLKSNEVYWIVEDIVEMRRLVGQLNSQTKLAQFELDERRLRHTCFADINDDQRYVSLVTKYPDGKQNRYEKISTDDLRMLVGFFKKKLSYQSGNDAVFALKRETGKIREILGLDQLPKD